MELEQKNYSDQATRLDLYRVNMNSVEDVFTDSTVASVVLKFSDKIPMITKGYRIGNYDLSKPDLTYNLTTDVIIFATDNQDSSERIKKAFNFIIKFCRENVKEPF